jgi:hypothetical protein
MVNELSSEASVVALYGVQFSPRQLETSYTHLVEWCDSLGFHPDRSGVSGKGFSENVGTFDRFDKRLQREGFEGVRGFNLYRLVPGGEIPGCDWCINAQVVDEYSCCIVGARSSIAPIPGESMLSITRTLIRDLSPVYGIGFRREMDLGPVLYAMGGCMGLELWGEERKQAERIQRWHNIGLEQRCYEKGFLRDIYPWSFLTGSQMSQQIEGIPLKQWIEQNRERGSLSPVEGGTWLWEVQKSQMPYVQSALENGGMIFDVTPASGR